MLNRVDEDINQINSDGTVENQESSEEQNLA